LNIFEELMKYCPRCGKKLREPTRCDFCGWDELTQKVENLLDLIDKMWKDDSTQDDVAEEAEALRAWLNERKGR
jgi:RNA polymerase subunit RPABC4/transcription elongation factor Spt4